MDARQAERFGTSYRQALQTWERAQVLMAAARALCEVALIRRWRPPGNVRDKVMFRNALKFYRRLPPQPH